MRDIVAVAYKCELETTQPAKLLLKRQHVCKRLARMVKVAQRIDHRHARPAGQVLDSVLRKRPGYNGVHPAIQVSGDVFERLAAIDWSFGQNRVPAKLPDCELEREPCAQ